MIKNIEIREENIIFSEITGKLKKGEIKEMHPFIHEIIAKNKKVRWYFEMIDFKGWDMEGFYEDLKMDASHADDYEKIAMVGDKKWEDMLAKGMKPFTSAEVKFFDLNQKDMAWEWIRE